ncbi:antitoxin VapB family protein [Candidatus Pacearchaeota archaeon]|nr:antitoxin VapB family protein [Candidatus Pacearchaeota archaeon]
MVSINISIRREAYDFLRKLKNNDKSFSDVILEFKQQEKKGSKEAIMKFFGALKEENVNWKEREKRMKEFKAEFEKRFK